MSRSQTVMLPTNVKPSRYTLALEPDMEASSFLGHETIEVDVLASTSSITMNASELQISSCRILPGVGNALAASSIDENEKAETVTFTFPSDVAVGPATLEIEFVGVLNDKLRGFYRSHYTDIDGNERHLATTQFEATDARRAFPCWDEPSLKATFALTLLVDSGLAAISNMPIAEDTAEPDGRKRLRFDETPIMSTYLLAFIIGDLKCVEQEAEDGTLIRIWATAGKEEQGRFALETAIRLLKYFNEYFGTPYPLPKLDHLAIPDFAAGAMENWGAITYREVVLLVDPDRTSAAVRQRVAGIISHEMAHMWFGDLVTMAWWKELWLNESFASWVGDKAVDALFPEYEMWTEFVSGDTTRALSLDGLKNSHPIEQEVRDPAEIGQLFDAISYSKGGSVLRMLEHYLGADTFRDGLRRYIVKHQYANASTHDLWDALAEASGEPVAEIMDTWVEQIGYPVVHVESDRSMATTELRLSQTRFVYEHLTEPQATYDTTWHVPVSITSQDAGSASLLMDQSKATASLGKSSEGWLKLNPDQIGFYRVNYSADDWDRLRPAVEALEVSTIDRLGLQNDAYALAKAGYAPMSRFLSLAQAYTNEINPSVWEDISANLGGLNSLLSDEAYYGEFRDLARGIFEPIGARVGWEPRPGEGHLDTLLRSTVLTQLGKYLDEDTLSQASSLFGEYLKDPAAVNPDLRGVIFNLTAQRGDRDTYDTLWDQHKTGTLEEEKVRLLVSLGHFDQPELLGETLDRALSDDVRKHDTILVVRGVGSNRNGRDLAWDFVKENWDTFVDRYADGLFALSNLVPVVSRFNTEEKLADVEEFFATHPTPAADRAIKQALEVIRLNVAWINHNRNELGEWLEG